MTRTATPHPSSRRLLSRLCPAGALVAVACVGSPSVRVVVLDGALGASPIEIHEVGPSRPATQSFPAPADSIAGIELFVGCYPRTEPLDVAIRVVGAGRQLCLAEVPIPTRVPTPVRVTFPPALIDGEVRVEAWAPHGRPGHNAVILAHPVDRTPGDLWIGDRLVAGDALFRVLAPDRRGRRVVVGLDLFAVHGRFPSPDLAEGRLSQAFSPPRDTLVGIALIAGTGASPTPPTIAWELSTRTGSLGRGEASGVGDNVPFTIVFPPLCPAQQETLVLTLVASGGSVRAWLCGGGEGVGTLAFNDRAIPGSLVMRTLHEVPSEDSLRVLLDAAVPLTPEPSPPVAGTCTITQSIRLPEECPEACFGIRLAVGGRLVAGTLHYETGDACGVLARGSLPLSGGANDYVWLELGDVIQGPRWVTVSGRDLSPSTAPRFWWVPGDLSPGGEASGCVPEAEGDLVFRVARRFGLAQWVASFPGLSARLAPPRGVSVVRGLLVTRFVLAAALACTLVVGRGRGHERG